MKYYKLVLILLKFTQFCDCKGVIILHGGRGNGNLRYRRPNSHSVQSEVTNYYISFNIRSSSYGSSFGKNRLPQDTHIFNDNYKNFLDYNKPFLTESLYKDQEENSMKSELRGWNDAFDHRWRRTTKMPYFENNIPSEDIKLPAAAVIGAAKAFGLRTLLPLNVPSNKPLMYCPDRSLQQAKILLENKLYWCSENHLIIECINEGIEVVTDEIVETLHKNLQPQREDAMKAKDNSTLNSESLTTSETLLSDQSESIDLPPKREVCFSNEIPCNSTIAYIDQYLVCKSGALLSNSKLFCDSLTENDSNQETILNCYFGYLPSSQSSFIPTTEDPTLEMYPVKPETSVIYDTVSFFVDLFSSDKKSGKGISGKNHSQNDTTDWLPEATRMDFGE